MSKSALTLGATALMVSGCTWLHPVDPEVRAPIVMPHQFSLGTATSSVTKSQWWVALRDPALDELEAKAFAHNLDLKRAFHRIDRAQALSAGADAGFWPTLNGEGAVTRSRNTVPGPNPFGFEQTTGSLSLGAAYELDLFGKIKSLSSAADFELLATRHDLDALAMSISAQVAETWFQLVEQRVVIDLVDSQIASNRTYLELTELRFAQGQATALDVLQQRQQTAGTLAQRPLVEARVRTLEHQLAVLLGRAPTENEARDVRELVELPPLPATGVPSEVIRRRPDVRAAELRVVAADYRVGAAIAERFPSIRLSGNIGLRIFSLSSFFDNVIWSIAASIAGPIFDGGRLKAAVDRNKAELADALTAYGQTALIALREVEDALVREDRQRAHLDQLTIQVDAGQKTLDEARTRYLNGLSDYLPVLTALRQTQQLEQQLVAARRQLLSYRIQLCRSLGGDWMQSLERPTFAVAEDKETEARP